MTLPIDSVLPKLLQTLSSNNNVVLQAPPGAGKTTRVPLALLKEEWLGDRKVIMLEPRRLAARAAANFMAKSLGEPVGETVGYRVRLDTKVGPMTKIEVVTEGILTRMLQEDPSLEAFGAVIFDEFHERSLQADLGLALSLECQAALRDDLRLLVMSATLDGEAVSSLMGDAPMVTSEGRSYPVDVRYLSRELRQTTGQITPIENVVPTIHEALREEKGSILVFLPGVAEIKKIESQLRASSLGDEVVLAPLYGNLSQKEQDRAIAPTAAGKRKIVLATNIAETSLTIDGIRIVVDAGLMRVPRFEPNSGMTKLETVSVSQASADQRCGRAGRLEEGVCYRLWPEGKHLLAHGEPEIKEADLLSLVLELAQWGCADPNELAWIDPPPAASYAQARDLLIHLGALDEQGRITSHGQQVSKLPLHPRLAHMVIKGDELGVGALACDIAALLSERDLLRRSEAKDADIYSRLIILLGDQVGGVDRGALRRVQDTAKQWRRQLKIKSTTTRNDLDMVGVMLAFAYPDRIAQRRQGTDGRYLLTNGRGAYFSQADPLAKSNYLVVSQLDGADKEARIFLATSIEKHELEKYCSDQIVESDFVEWDSSAEAVKPRHQKKLGAIVLEDKALASCDDELVVQTLVEGIRKLGISCLPWNKKTQQFKARIQFLHKLDCGQWPDMSNEALLENLEEWLAPFLTGMSRRAHLHKIDLHAALLSQLTWDQQCRLDELAPTHITVPSGSRIPLDYDNDPPVLAVRLQEMFGAVDTPTIAGGKVKVLLHLLSPAQRPIQVTQALAGFWSGSYNEVKKEMKGRYPKHYWPDDPLQAEPTNRAKRK